MLTMLGRCNSYQNTQFPNAFFVPFILNAPRWQKIYCIIYYVFQLLFKFWTFSVSLFLNHNVLRDGSSLVLRCTYSGGFGRWS
jgi:hypothetical protein